MSLLPTLQNGYDNAWENGGCLQGQKSVFFSEWSCSKLILYTDKSVCGDVLCTPSFFLSIGQSNKLDDNTISHVPTPLFGCQTPEQTFSLIKESKSIKFSTTILKQVVKGSFTFAVLWFGGCSWDFNVLNYFFDDFLLFFLLVEFEKLWKITSKLLKNRKFLYFYHFL